MSKRQCGVLLVVALVAGLGGGVGASWVLTRRLVYAQPGTQPAKIIQAERVEIVDKDGKVRAVLGLEDDGESILRLADEDGKARAALMVKYGNPSLELYDEHGKPRVIEDLSRVIEARALVLRDEAGNIRAYLGPQQGAGCWKDPWFVPDYFSPKNTYSLRFYGLDKRCRASLTDGEEDLGPELELRAKNYDNSVFIRTTDQYVSAFFTATGLTYEESEREREENLKKLNTAKTDKERAEASKRMERRNHSVNLAAMSEGTQYVEIAEGGTSKAKLGVSHGEPSLELSDKDEKTRAALGSTELKNTRTGSVEKRSPASLVLFGEAGKVIWEAP